MQKEKPTISTIQSEDYGVVVMGYAFSDDKPEESARKEFQRYAATFVCCCLPDEPPEPVREFIRDLKSKKAYEHFTLRKNDQHKVYQIFPATDTALDFFMLLNHWQTTILERNIIEDNGKRGNRPAIVIVDKDDCLYMKATTRAKTP